MKKIMASVLTVFLMLGLGVTALAHAEEIASAAAETGTAADQSVVAAEAEATVDEAEADGDCANADQIKDAIIRVYGLDADIFEQLAAAGLNFGQAKAVAIIVGELNLGGAADDRDPMTVADVLALDSQGLGRLQRTLGLDGRGLAVGHILQEAGVVTPIDEDSEAEAASGRSTDDRRKTDCTGSRQQEQSRQHGNGQAAGRQKQDK